MHRDGYVDVPAFVRRPVICVAGGKQKGRERYKQEENCNRAASYNKATRRCQCNNPDADGVKLYPDKYKGFPEGVVCFDCDTTVEGRSVVFVLDQSGTVGSKGWTQVKFCFKRNREKRCDKQRNWVRRMDTYV
ncbi:hypothetical protein ANCCAN_02616 [Ancylostoma caninum]|uniref:VWA protein n=1 Tax=Ancylostoma caninum TaxID=29170 RepID=A0A368H7K8_ANCCA|nr:hypothetical protein ANCCAN_02616 [Ancylostoma caninum]